MTYTVFEKRLEIGCGIKTTTYKKIMIIYSYGDNTPYWYVAMFGVN